MVTMDPETRADTGLSDSFLKMQAAMCIASESNQCFRAYHFRDAPRSLSCLLRQRSFQETAPLP